MLDLKDIRHDVEAFQKKGQTRGVAPEVFETLLKNDEERRALIVQTEELKKYRNDVSETIAQLKKNKADANDKIAEMKSVGDKIKAIDQQLHEVDAKIEDSLSHICNMPHASVPVGNDENDNRLERDWGEPRTFDFEPKHHFEIAEQLDILDFERGAKVSGSRFVYYKGLGARLERACYNYMLDKHVDEHHYTELVPPYIVNAQSMYGTGQFPKFKEDVFQIQDEREFTLIPTAEVPLTNYYANEILKESDLPIYFTAFSPSFRSEAGSAGRDTRGLIRLHQFHKVEMVKLVHPEHSYEELDKMTADAQSILEDLKLPYRVLTLCTGDMGFSAAKTYDLEVWFPAQNTYREISSCSNCEAFQSRRAKIRFRHEDTGKVDFVHTLNGSGLAVGRTVAAILENYQNADGSVRVPDVLVPYMGGVTLIK